MIDNIFNMIASVIAITILAIVGAAAAALLVIAGVTAFVAFACLTVVKWFVKILAWMVEKLWSLIMAAARGLWAMMKRAYNWCMRKLGRTPTATATITDDDGNQYDVVCELIEAVPAPVQM